MSKAVIFDMDGLLIDSEPIWRDTEKEIFSRVGISLTDEMCFRTVGLRIDEVTDYWYSIYPWTHVPKTEITEAVIEGVIREIRDKGKALPGVYKVLDFFQRRKIPMGIASASPSRIINTVVDRLDIRSYFSVIHSAETEQYGKPHPAVYLSAARMLGVNPRECIVFEDSFNGIIAAKAARMKVIAVPELLHQGKAKFHAADYQLGSLDEFSEALWAKLKVGQ